ncbi:hypothetical protein CDL15_Pgr013834 [Punica granatum]|uniref:Uncharacterized protein n=1 Tax=Punica granatum TaxID=22663 RepID=A0A218VWA5_PUNGR|nr:hypothetical protein CDL15_Pgr013834 [Punica granatum]
MGRGGNNCNLLVLAADDAEIGYFAACCKIAVRLLQAVQRFWPRDLHGRRSCVRANPGMRRHLPADNTRAKVSASHRLGEDAPCQPRVLRMLLNVAVGQCCCGLGQPLHCDSPCWRESENYGCLLLR